MSWRTTLSLLLIVGILAFAVHWQQGREENYVEGRSEPLFEGVEGSRICSIRFEALDRPPGIRLERDSRGLWYLTDPISYPARPGMVEELLSIVRRNLAEQASPAEIALRDRPFERLGLFEVDERLGDGSRRTTSVEVGDVDIDGVRLWVRKDGRILRTVRNIDTMLQRSVHELRDDHIFAVRPDDLVRVERSGVDLRSGRALPIDLSADRDVYVWRLERPYRGQLDPTLFGLWLGSLTSLKISAFVDDDATELGPYGLAAPQVTLRLIDREGERHEVLFAQALDGGEWYAHKQGTPYVWALEQGASMRLFEPPEDYLDPQLVRVFRDDVRALEIHNAAGRIRIERVRGEREARWTVVVHTPDGGETMSRPAERAKVDELLGALESAELRHAAASSPFPAIEESGPELGVWVEDVHELRQGGRLGQAFAWPDGTRGRLFRRDKEDVVSFVSAQLERLVELDPSDVLSRRLLTLDEVGLRGLKLQRGEAALSYVRSNEGVWRHPQSKLEATELRPLLDSLVFLRASEHLTEEGPREELADPIRIEFSDAHAQQVSAIVGLDAKGRTVAEVLGQRSLLADQELHGKLRALFER